MVYDSRLTIKLKSRSWNILIGHFLKWEDEGRKNLLPLIYLYEGRIFCSKRGVFPDICFRERGEQD
jgi:hypothetical protein